MTHAPRQTVVSIIFGNELFGKERGTLEALKTLKSSGVEVVVCVSGREPEGGSVGDEARANGFTTVVFPGGTQFHLPWFYRNPRFFIRQVGRLFTNSRALLRVLAQFKPSAILLNGTMEFLFCKLALSIVRTPVIYRIGDAPPTDSKFQMLLWRQLLKRSTHIVCISHFVAKQVKAHIDSSQHHRISVIWNRVVSRTPLSTNKQAVLEGADKPELTLAYVGQVDKIKGVDVLVRAALNLDNPALCLHLIGGSPHTASFEAELRRFVQDSESLTRIHFQGYVDDPRILLSQADWHIAPSICEEAFGNVVLEAKQIGIPSVISKNGGLPELVEEGVDGFVLDEVSSQSIENQINSLFECKADWEKMGACAKTSLQKKFSDKSFEFAWKALWSETLRESHRF